MRQSWSCEFEMTHASSWSMQAWTVDIKKHAETVLGWVTIMLKIVHCDMRVTVMVPWPVLDMTHNSGFTATPDAARRAARVHFDLRRRGKLFMSKYSVKLLRAIGRRVGIAWWSGWCTRRSCQGVQDLDGSQH